MNKIKQSILAIVIGLALAAGVSWAQIYKDPTCNPPNCNTPTPINVGIENQQKGGGAFFTSPFGGINVNGAANFGGAAQFTNVVRINGTVNTPADGRVLTATDSVGTAKWKTMKVQSKVYTAYKESSTAATDSTPSKVVANGLEATCQDTSGGEVITGCLTSCLGHFVDQGPDVSARDINGNNSTDSTPLTNPVKCVLGQNDKCVTSTTGNKAKIRIRAVCTKITQE